MSAHTLTVGGRVEGGDTAEDYDRGTITEITGESARVAWDSGVTTWQAARILRSEGTDLRGLVELYERMLWSASGFDYRTVDELRDHAMSHLKWEQADAIERDAIIDAVESYIAGVSR